MASLLLMLSLLAASNSQPSTGTIAGTIFEARTHAPLAAVLVKVQSTGQQEIGRAHV